MSLTASLTPPAVVNRFRLLVVDDDPDFRALLSEYLRAHEFEVQAADNRKEMRKILTSGDSDLVVLDLRLGAEDGLDALRDVRAKGDVPVIVLTGHRCEEVDRVVGLELGADDYLTKPVGLRELLARIRTVLRRVEDSAGADKRLPGKSYFAGWALDRRLRQLTNPSGVPIKLTKGEYALLVAFVDTPNRALSRDALLQATRVHGEVYDRSIDVQILRLRRKLEIDPSVPRMILTERGFGYMFSVPVSTPP